MSKYNIEFNDFIEEINDKCSDIGLIFQATVNCREEVTKLLVTFESANHILWSRKYEFPEVITLKQLHQGAKACYAKVRYRVLKGE